VSVLSGRRILLGVTGGIAAYKAVYLCRMFQEAGAEVRAAMTPSGTRFVTPLTFEAITQHPVATEIFPDGEFVATRHIAWAQWADLVVVAPATYDFAGKLASGIADDILSTLVAAVPRGRPVFLALAMNSEMYDNPAFQANVRTLTERGFQIIDAETGYLAERMEGKGRMAEPAAILAAVERSVEANLPWRGRRVLVTAGPTREKIDPVRFLSNASSGKMGFALAEAAAQLGAEVTLIAGPVTLDTPRGVTRRDVTSAADMAAAVAEAWPRTDALFMVAAVADYVPREPAGHKIKKSNAPVALALEAAPDILAACGQSKRDEQVLVGFAVETENDLANARAKLEAKKLDLIVVNNPTTPGAAFEVDTNVVTIIGPDVHRTLPLLPKREVAHHILELTLPLFRRAGSARTA
jgi:phosphopantothenoylcysteine decarboxylase/phosphopantothenate--cysteine ligase